MLIYKKDYKCKQRSPQLLFTSFELTSFEVGGTDPVFCAVAYRPPKYNKNFINEFTDFPAEIMQKFDRVLIVGDFNIHVCCLDKSMGKDFLTLIDSFNLVQSVTGPTHRLGHTLDLVLSYGLLLSNMEICDSGLSDHMSVLFDVLFKPINHCPPARCCRILKLSSADQFSAAFNQLSIPPYNSSSNIEELCSWLDSTCQRIFDSVAPIKTRQPRPKPEPWFNDRTHAVRRDSRRAERKWKKDKLEVSHQMMKDCWRRYQTSVKEEKSKYLTNVMSSNSQNPRVLHSKSDSKFCAKCLPGCLT